MNKLKRVIRELLSRIKPYREWSRIPKVITIIVGVIGFVSAVFTIFPFLNPFQDTTYSVPMVEQKLEKLYLDENWPGMTKYLEKIETHDELKNIYRYYFGIDTVYNPTLGNPESYFNSIEKSSKYYEMGLIQLGSYFMNKYSNDGNLQIDNLKKLQESIKNSGILSSYYYFLELRITDLDEVTYNHVDKVYSDFRNKYNYYDFNDYKLGNVMTGKSRNIVVDPFDNFKIGVLRFLFESYLTILANKEGLVVEKDRHIYEMKQILSVTSADALRNSVAIFKVGGDIIDQMLQLSGYSD